MRRPTPRPARNADLILEAFRDLAAAERDIVGRHIVASTEGLVRWVRAGPAFETEADLDDLVAALNYVLCIPRREHGLRVFCSLPLLFAVRTVELSRSNPAV